MWTVVGDEVRVIEGVGAVGSADFIVHAGEATGGSPAREYSDLPQERATAQAPVPSTYGSRGMQVESGDLAGAMITVQGRWCWPGQSGSRGVERRAELSGFADGVEVGCERKTGLWGWRWYLLRWRTVGKEGVLLNALVIRGFKGEKKCQPWIFISAPMNLFIMLPLSSFVR